MFGEAGQVLSMSYIPLVSPLAPTSCDELDPMPESAEFTSKISYETPSPGMSLRPVLAGEKPPPGLKFLQYKRGPNNQGTANGPNPILNDGSKDGQPPPAPSGPFGFLSKYWYVLLPIMILNIMMAPAPTDQQQQQAPPTHNQDGTAAQQGGSGVPSPRGAVEGSSAPTRALPAAAGTTAAASGNASRQRRGKRG
jgi:hypothetical protein